MVRDINMFDEGIILVDAMRMSHGDVIHRDFYSGYGPGQYAIVAMLFKLFGVNAFAPRLYGLLTLAAILATVVTILYQRVHMSMVVSACAVGYLWFLADPQYLYPVFPCTLIALWGSKLLATALQNPKPFMQLFGAGVGTGLVALFRYDAGLFLMVAHLVAILATAVILTLIAPQPRRDVMRRHSRYMFIYCLGLGVIFLPFALAFLAVAPVQSFFTDFIDYSRKYYAQMRGLPFPSLSMMMSNWALSVVYLPLVSGAIAVIEIIKRVRQSRLSVSADQKSSYHEEIVFLTVFGLVAFAFFFKGFVRVSALHMLMANIPSLIVVTFIVNGWLRSVGAGRFLAVMLGVLVAVPAAAGGWRQIKEVRDDISRPFAGWLLGQSGWRLFQDRERYDCTELIRDSAVRPPINYLRVARYLKANTAPDEAIFVGVRHHDRIFVDAVTLYFLAERLPATHWHQFDPGLQTRADIQSSIITELDTQGTKWVVRDGSFENSREPNGSAFSSGVTILDNYLKAHYRPVASAGTVEIWLLNDVPTPAPSSLACTAPAFAKPD